MTEIIYKDCDGFLNIKGQCRNSQEHFSRIGFVDTIGEGKVVKFSCTSCNAIDFITLKDWYNNKDYTNYVKELG